MLADDGIEFLDLHLFRHGAFVLGRGVKVARAGAGNEFDFVSHERHPLYFVAAFTDFGQYRVNADFIDDAHSLGGKTKTYPPILAFYPKFVMMEIGIEAPLGSIVGVRNVIARNGTFAGDLAYFGHGRPRVGCLYIQISRTLYQTSSPR